MEVKKHNANSCAKQARREGTIGNILDRAMTRDTFGFFLNLTIYRARSRLECQFGTTPIEAIMKWLKAYKRLHFNNRQGKVDTRLVLLLEGPDTLHAYPGRYHMALSCPTLNCD